MNVVSMPVGASRFYYQHRVLAKSLRFLRSPSQSAPRRRNVWGQAALADDFNGDFDNEVFDQALRRGDTGRPPFQGGRSYGARRNNSRTTSVGNQRGFPDLRSPQEWLVLFDAKRNEFATSGRESLQALRRLGELISPPAASAELDHQTRTAIGTALDNLFPCVYRHIDTMQPPLQVSVLHDVAQLGTAFEQYEWRQYCPPVPVYLLDALLDRIVSSLPMLTGPQTSRLVQALTKLQLTDEVTYERLANFVVERVEEDDLTFNQLHVLSMLARTFVVGLESWPHILSQETQLRLLETLAKASAEQIRQDRGITKRAIALVAKTFAEYAPAAFPALYGAVSDWLATQTNAYEPADLGNLVLGFTREEYSGFPIAATLQRHLLGNVTVVNPRLLVKIVMMHAETARPNAEFVTGIAQELLRRGGHDECGASGLWAACHAGCANKRLIADALALYPGIFSQQQLRPQRERALCLLLDALRVSSYDASREFAEAHTTVCEWIAAGTLRMWRTVAYMRTFALSPYPCDDLMALAMRSVPQELGSDRTRHSIGPNMRIALQACVVVGNLKYCEALMGMPALLDSLQGGEAQQWAQLLCDIAPVRCRAGTACLEAVWGRVEGGLGSLSPDVVARAAHAVSLSGVAYERWAPSTLKALQLDAAAFQKPATSLSKFAPRAAHLLLEAVLNSTGGQVDRAAVAAEVARLQQEHGFLPARVAGGPVTVAAPPTPPPVVAKAPPPTPQKRQREQAPAAVVQAADDDDESDEEDIDADVEADAVPDRPEDSGRDWDAEFDRDSAALDRELAAYSRELGLDPAIIDSLSDDSDVEEGAHAAAAVPAAAPEPDYNAMTVPQLKDLLRDRGLAVGGKKSDLIARLLSVVDAAAHDAAAVRSEAQPQSGEGVALADDTAGGSSAQEAIGSDVSDDDSGFQKSLRAEASDREDRAADAPTAADWERQTVAQLKQELRSRALPVTGTKAELIQRLLSAGEAAGAPAASDDATPAGKGGRAGDAGGAPAQNGDGGARASGEQPAWDSLTVAQLKGELRARGLTVSGTKAELVQRLAEHERRAEAVAAA